MRSCRYLILVVAVSIVALAPCLADQVVYFLNGKAIVVKSIEKGPKFTVLEIEGGGRMGVPTDQISRIEEYVVAQPAAPVVAPLVAIAPAVTPPAQPAVATAQPGGVGGQPAVAAQQALGQAAPPPVMPSVPGPGMGGRPAGGPGRSLAGLTPIGVGGDGSVPMPTMRNIPEPRRGMGAGGQMQGPPGSRQNSVAGRRNGRPGMGGGGRSAGPSEISRPRPQGQLAEPPRTAQPSTAPPAAPAAQAPSPAVQADDPPAAEDSEHDESSEQPAAPSEDENEPSDDSSGSSK